MPRPQKTRRVCCLPSVSRFSPEGNDSSDNTWVIMSVDEYETIRLIDYEGFNQLECSTKMNVARTTVQSIYESARNKLANCIVDGKTLVIKGGAYDLCNPHEGGCGRGCQHRKRQNKIHKNLRSDINE